MGLETCSTGRRTTQPHIERGGSSGATDSTPNTVVRLFLPHAAAGRPPASVGSKTIGMILASFMTFTHDSIIKEQQLPVSEWGVSHSFTHSTG